MSSCAANYAHPNSIVALPVTYCSGRPILSPPLVPPAPSRTCEWRPGIQLCNPWSDSAISQQSDNTPTVPRTYMDARIFAWNSLQNLSIQDRQRSINVTLKRVRITIVAMERE